MVLVLENVGNVMLTSSRIHKDLEITRTYIYRDIKPCYRLCIRLLIHTYIDEVVLVVVVGR